MTGFFPREHDAERSWRWMGADAAWTVVNTSAQPIVATLDLEMSAFHHPRRLALRLDGRPVLISRRSWWSRCVASTSSVR